MPRPPKQKLDFTMDSVKSHLQEVYNQLEELRTRAVRDYNRAIAYIKDDEDLNIMEVARNNAQKSIENFFTKKTELLKVHVQIVQTLGKNAAEAEDAKNSGAWGEDTKLEMQKMLQDLKKIN
jgi:hypothetical protein